MKWLRTINLFLRSCFFTFYVAITSLFYSFICVLAWPLPLRCRYFLIMSWTRSAIWILKHVCYLDYQIEGLENIPKNRNGIILSKHQSTWETFFLPPLFYQTAIILKRELFWVPFFGWGLATIDPIAINRNDSSSAMDQVIQKGKKCLDAGRWILIFPEGTRIPVGHVGKYRLGGARLAVATHAPILPVAHNAGRFWPRRTFIKRPGTIRIVFGALIETEGRTPEDVMHEVKTWIEQTIVKIDEEGKHDIK